MINKSILASLLPALLLGGCMGTENRGVESVHQPVVSRSDYAFDLGVAGGFLAPGEQQRLADWMTMMRPAYGDRIAVDDAAFEAPRARADVAAMVASYGLVLGNDAPVTRTPHVPGTIRVVVSRLSADVPRCPDWSRDSSNEFAANASSNYGCAVNRNLAAMVANPADLVHGTPGKATTDAATSYKAIDAYRRRVPTGATGLGASTGATAGGR